MISRAVAVGQYMLNMGKLARQIVIDTTASTDFKRVGAGLPVPSLVVLTDWHPPSFITRCAYYTRSTCKLGTKVVYVYAASP